MKARGLVRDKTLGQVVSRHQQSSASASYGDGGSSKTR
jgi:hypothetical protein